ncbi:hypothetical protein OROHE_014485 [Orobanche hederae]
MKLPKGMRSELLIAKKLLEDRIEDIHLIKLEKVC